MRKQLFTQEAHFDEFGNLIVVFPDAVLEELGWKVNDLLSIDFVHGLNGLNLRNKSKELRDSGDEFISYGNS
jgi:hypothetical protein